MSNIVKINNYGLVNVYFRAKKAKSLSAVKQKEIEAHYNNSLARRANVLFKIANSPEINPRYRQILQAQASAIVAGKPLSLFATFPLLLIIL